MTCQIRCILGFFMICCTSDTFQSAQKSTAVQYPTKAATNAQNTDHKVIQFSADSPSTARGIPLMVGEVIASEIDLTCVQLAPLLDCTNLITILGSGYGNTNRSLWSISMNWENVSGKITMLHEQILICYLHHAPYFLRPTGFVDTLYFLSSLFQRSSTLGILVTLIQSMADFKWNISSKINLVIV